MTKESRRSNRVPPIDLRALEEEVLSEGREWMQRRMEEKLREKRKSFSPEGGDASSGGPASQADA